MSISSIDDLLMGGSTPQNPMPPEEKQLNETAEIEELEEDNEPEEHHETHDEPEDDHMGEQDDAYDEEEEPEVKHKKEYDEYGNEKEPENKEIRDRLARQAKKFQAEIDDLRMQLAQSGASQQVQKAAQDFEFDPNAEGNWQQQLAQFVRQEVANMNRDNEKQKMQQIELQTQQQFEQKFKQGMEHFHDFRDVITNLDFQITDHMTLATRAMDNPAAFLYAAAKRHPQELERISKLRDPIAQVAEIGKLEERMKKSKPLTKAPRPLAKLKEDTVSKTKPKEKDTSGDDLLAKADAKRLNVVKQRLRGNR